MAQLLRFVAYAGDFWHERQESNLQPTVLETAALPIELRSYLAAEVGLEPTDSAVRAPRFYL